MINKDHVIISNKYIYEDKRTWNQINMSNVCPLIK